MRKRFLDVIFSAGIPGETRPPPVLPSFLGCEEVDMDVARLNNVVTAAGSKDAPKARQTRAPKTPPPGVKSMEARTVALREEVRAALDRVIRNTRFQYVLKDEVDYFIVRIIDKDTDKVIREIPSKELQRLHEGVQEAIGLLFDQEI